MMLVGFKIKKLRELRNYTQSYMAAALSVTQSTYSRYECDEVECPDEIFTRIATILGLSPAAIVHFDEQKLFEHIEWLYRCEHTPIQREKELYEQIIQLLSLENQDLREQVSFLKTLLPAKG